MDSGNIFPASWWVGQTTQQCSLKEGTSGWILLWPNLFRRQHYFITFNLVLNMPSILITYHIMGNSYLMRNSNLRTSTLSECQPGRAETFFLSLPPRPNLWPVWSRSNCLSLDGRTHVAAAVRELDAWQMQARLGWFGSSAKSGHPRSNLVSH